MDLNLTDEQEAFRAEAGDWLRANAPGPLPSMNTEAGFAAHLEWEHELFENRWAVVS